MAQPETVLHQYEQSPLAEVPSERELAVLQLIANGIRESQIAGELIVAQETVRRDVKRARRKLGAKNRTQAVAISLRRGLIQ